MNDTIPDTILNTCLDSVRTAIGRERFDHGTPDQTLRPGSTTVLNPSSDEAALPQTSELARTRQLAAETLPIVSVAPESGGAFSDSQSLDGLARSSEYSLRERVGKGGMGEIFLASQNALRRDVAIKKIIPEHLERSAAKKIENAFVSEALVTGFLDHPNIVPVHALGRDDAGNWFFSMKMVRGIEWRLLLHPERCKDPETKEKALAHKLDIDDPARRAAHLEENLRILLSVCNAVAFAHSKHIIHRDLKPENVMVGAFGEVLAMDWGLAVDVSDAPPSPSHPERRVPPRGESNFGGTPSYMAPEQVYFDENGRSSGAYLGLWTDVFLLGAMLYELLKGHAPYMESSVQDALRKVAQCAPSPLPENAPSELAAICRKAMGKNPGERYPDALAFQSALQEFLTHREAAAIAAKAEQEVGTQEIPHLARAVVLYDQALELWPGNAAMAASAQKARTMLGLKENHARWVRRSLAGAVGAIVVGLTVGFFWIRGERQKAVAEKVRADANEKAALAARGDAEAKSAELAKASVISDKRADLLLAALDKQIFEIQDELDKQPGMQEIKKKLLVNAVEGYKQALDTLPNSAYAEWHTAAAFSKLGDISLDIGETVAAAAAYKKALDICERLAPKVPESEQPQYKLSLCYKKLGYVSLQLGDAAGALEFYKKYLAVHERLAAADPKSTDAQYYLATAYIKLGDVSLQLADTAGTLDFYEKALAICERLAAVDPKQAEPQCKLSIAYEKLGDVSLKLGDKAEALNYYKKSLAVFERLAAADVQNAEAQRDLALSNEKLGDVSLKQNDAAEALVFYKKALAISERLAMSDPKNANAQYDLSKSLNNVGEACLSLGDAAALGFYKKSLAIRERLAAENPRSTGAQYDLSNSYGDLAAASLRLGDTVGALDYCKKSLAICERLAAEDPKNAQAQRDLAHVYGDLGDVRLKTGDTAGALNYYKTALAISERLAAEDPKAAEAQRTLAVAYGDLGDVSLKSGDAAGALEFYKKKLATCERLAVADPKNEQAQFDVGRALCNLVNVSVKLNDTPGALEYCKKAVWVVEQLATADSKSPEAQRNLWGVYGKLGNECLKLGDKAGALNCYTKCTAILERLTVADPKNEQAQSDLLASYGALASVCDLLKKYAEELVDHRKACATAEAQFARLPNDGSVRTTLVAALNNLSWMLSTCENTAFRNPEEAVLLARRAVELTENKNEGCLDTLAMALFRNGERDKAIETQKKAIALLPKDLPAAARKDYDAHLKAFESAPDPKDAQSQREHSIANEKLGDESLKRGDLAGALDYYQKSLALREGLAVAAPNNAEAQVDLFDSQLRLGHATQKLKDFKAAVEWFEKAVDTARAVERNGKWPASRKNDIASAQSLLDECRKAHVGDGKEK